VRRSLKLCSWRDRKAVAADLRKIYQAQTAAIAAEQLDAFEAAWRDNEPHSRRWAGGGHDAKRFLLGFMVVRLPPPVA
jgi:transposase-like protein